MKQRAHALELISDPPCLFLVSCCRHDEVWAAHFNPVLDFIASRSGSAKKNQQGQKSFVHCGPPPRSGWRHYKSEWASPNTYSRTSVTSAAPCQPVLAHQFVGPRGLPDLSARKEFTHHRLDIDDRRPVDGVQFGDKEVLALDARDVTDRAADAIRAVLGALREDADFGPLFIISGVTCIRNDLCRINLRQEEEHFCVREVGQSCESIRRELVGEGDAGFFFAPEIVLDFRAGSANESDWTQLDLQWSQ